MPPIEEYIAEVSSLWESHWLTNMGDKHRELENLLKAYLEVENVALFTNGHSALECALEAMNLKGKVITTPFTFASTVHAIARKGLEPVFADIDPITYTIDPKSIEQLVDSSTCAILPVHVYGNICNNEAIQEIANRYNLKVIYDAAHAFGIKKDGASIATYGDASMFSFHATKVFNTIEGGAVCFSDSSLKSRVDQWKNFGITGPESVEYVGGNAKMNEFCAAMGICNLRHLDEEISKRKKVATRYMDNLSTAPGVRLCISSSSIEANYAYMPIVFESAHAAVRNEVHRALCDEGIAARKYFYPLASDYFCYRGRFDSSKTPVAQYISDRVLTLPMYADLAMADIDRICSIVINTVRMYGA